MSRNIDRVRRVAVALGDLRGDVVFVGGAIVDMLITDAAAPPLRLTYDIDLVVEIATYGEWASFSERLRAIGFREDTRAGAPLCRWIVGDISVDFMPAAPCVLGFTNRWYAFTPSESQTVALDEARTYRIATAPLFLATKIEAFRGRGEGDFVASHDVEDVVAVVDGRSSIVEDTKSATLEVREYLHHELSVWLDDQRFIEAVPGHLPGDVASQARAVLVLSRLRAIAGRQSLAVDGKP